MAYIVVVFEYDGGGEYTVLAPDNAVVVNPAGPETLAHAHLLQGWAYASGTRPQIHSDRMIAGSEGTKMAVHIIEGSDDHRIILLEGGPLVVQRSDGPESQTITSSPQFVDVVYKDGEFDAITSPEPFDEINTPGSERIMELINEARVEHDID